MLDRSEKARELNEFKLAGFSLLAVRTGLEPATPCVTGMYSNQAELPHQSSYFKERKPLFCDCDCKITSLIPILQIFNEKKLKKNHVTTKRQRKPNRYLVQRQI